jgi:hypothetical protein
MQFCRNAGSLLCGVPHDGALVGRLLHRSELLAKKRRREIAASSPFQRRGRRADYGRYEYIWADYGRNIWADYGLYNWADYGRYEYIWADYGLYNWADYGRYEYNWADYSR